MARISVPVRRLTAADLGVGPSEIDGSSIDPGAIIGDEEKPAKRVPELTQAPIITDIIDHRLVTISRYEIEQNPPTAELNEYLTQRFHAVISDIEGQASKIVVDDFRLGERMLLDWSVSKVLAFGTHLYLLEDHVLELKMEFLDDKVRRLEALIKAARQFINSFDEWRSYVQQSALIDTDTGEAKSSITSDTDAAAASLLQDKESVDPEIPAALTRYTQVARSRRDGQGYLISIMGALRAVTNISITFTNYIVQGAKDGYQAISKDKRALKLLKIICRFFPSAMRLAANHSELFWLLDYTTDIRVACEVLKG